VRGAKHLPADPVHAKAYVYFKTQKPLRRLSYFSKHTIIFKKIHLPKLQFIIPRILQDYTMPEIKVGDYLFTRLRQLGIDSVFGVPGGLPWLAFQRTPDSDNINRL
jgi:hypothetical protein